MRFAFAVVLTLLYVAFAVFISAEWRGDLRDALGPIAAWAIPTLLAYVPGFFVAFMIFSLIASSYRPPAKQPPGGPWDDGTWPPVTVVIAALDEEIAIRETIRRMATTNYEGPLELILADNGSTDRTAEIAEATARECGVPFRRAFEPEPGKHRALNAALALVETPLLITLDADTYTHPDALSYLVSRICERPQGQLVSACAGALIVENATENMLTRMEAWDYRLAINGVKGMQASYNSTLVAQGAFSVYRTEDIVAIGGWPDAIGEDIVLTWSLLAERGLTLYEPGALASTTAPAKLRSFVRQRARWARGMLEGLTERPPPRQPRYLARLVGDLDYLVPLLDIGLVFFWVPGIILFLLGYPLIFAWISMLILPVTVVILLLLRRWQLRHVLKPLGVSVERNVRGFIGYLLIYQVIASAAALRGYAEFIAGTSRRW